jgi:hypothetical protein
MNYSFGVPAWLGAIRVSVVLLGLPILFAVGASLLARFGLGWSGEAVKNIYPGVFGITFIAQLVILILRSRSAARHELRQQESRRPGMNE